jgi:hypothetical protein
VTAMAARHAYRPGDQRSVTVPGIVARVAAEGLPVRLAWPEARPGWRGGRVEWCVDDAPTGYLPAISDTRR